MWEIFFFTFDLFVNCLKGLCQETGHVFEKKCAKSIESTHDESRESLSPRMELPWSVVSLQTVRDLPVTSDKAQAQVLDKSQ